MEDRLRQAFVEGLDLDPQFAEWDGLKYRGIREWDSVAHMQLVGEIEEAFDVRLDSDDVIGMSSYTIAKEILGKYDVVFV